MGFQLQTVFPTVFSGGGTSWYGKYPILYRVLAPSQVVIPEKSQVSHSPCSWQLVVNSHSSMPRQIPKKGSNRCLEQKNKTVMQKFKNSSSNFMSVVSSSFSCCCSIGGSSSSSSSSSCCCCFCCGRRHSCAAPGVLLWLCCSGCVVPVVLLYYVELYNWPKESKYRPDCSDTVWFMYLGYPSIYCIIFSCVHVFINLFVCEYAYTVYIELFTHKDECTFHLYILGEKKKGKTIGMW